MFWVNSLFQKQLCKILLALKAFLSHKIGHLLEKSTSTKKWNSIVVIFSSFENKNSIKNSFPKASFFQNFLDYEYYVLLDFFVVFWFTTPERNKIRGGRGGGLFNGGQSINFPGKQRAEGIRFTLNN